MLKIKQKWLLGLSIFIIVVGAVFVHSRLALQEFEHVLAPAEQNKARIIGEGLSRLVSKMLYYGVPVERLRGMRAIFNEIQTSHPDLVYIALQQGDKLLYLSWKKPGISLFYSIAEPALSRSTASFFDAGDTFPSSLHPDPKWVKAINQKVESIGHQALRLTLGIDKQYIARQQRDILLDSLTVLLVTLLMGMELMFFLYVFAIARPFNTLKQAMERMSAGDFTKVYEFDSQDEIGRSGLLLNRIIMRLNQRFYRSISEYGRSSSNTTSEANNTLQKNVARFGSYKKLSMILEEALIYVRPPLFLVVFAESMSLSFFPGYVSTLYGNMASFPVPKDLLIGLPISVFMLVWGLTLPKAGLWSERKGRKRTFLIGGCLTAAGLVMTAFSQDILQLLLFRSFTAVGYGIVFITAQGYVADLTTAKNRTRGMAVFLSGFFSGALSGAATGGILADQIGYQKTFMLSAVLAVGSALFASRFFVSHPLARQKDKPKIPEKAFNLPDLKKLFTNKYFLSITLFSSIPAKAALTGIIYFAGPVYMASIGASKSDIGRVLMLYGLLIILISPTSAWLVDKWRKPHEFILLGGVLSCLALWEIAWTETMAGMALGIAGLGLAHACSVPSQAAMINARVPCETGISSGKIIGLYRLTERIGNISGPILAALLISYTDYHQAFIIFGAIILTGSIVFYFLINYQSSLPSSSATQEVK